VQLAASVATVLADEPDGLSCDALAWRLHRRRADVLATLKADARFARIGATNGARWRLVTRTHGTEWDGIDNLGHVLGRLAVIDARLGFLEGRNGARA